MLGAAPAFGAPLAPRGAADLGLDWDAPTWRWQRLPVNASGQGDGLLALAVAAPGTAVRVAVADAAGVSVREESGAFRFVARIAGVTDLAFARDGSLWIASLTGLWSLGPDGRLSPHPPAAGEGAQAVRRVATSQGLVAVATDAGAWVSRDGRAWQRLADGLPNDPVSALAWLATDADAGERQLWLVVGSEVWRVRLATAGPRLVLAEARRVPVAGAPSGEVPTDLVLDLADAQAAIVYPRAIAVLPSQGGSFSVLRPVLPPGSTVRRLVAGAGRLWLATDQGLLQAPGLAGPWRRTGAPAGSASIHALSLTPTGDGLLAVGPLGLLRGAPILRAQGEPPPSEPSPRPSARARTIPPDPDVRDVQAAALRYLDLGPARMRSLWDGLSVRGWIPSLSLRVAGARDRSWGRDWDDAVSSGDRYLLTDHDKDHSLDLEASLVMTWDLPGLAFDDDAIEISREHRLVVSLRDNVIDEIDQMYFERRGLLEKLRSGDPASDVGALELRAAELAAGLDAWTGGWFSRSRPGPDETSLPVHPPPGPRPNAEERP